MKCFSSDVLPLPPSARAEAGSLIQPRVNDGAADMIVVEPMAVMANKSMSSKGVDASAFSPRPASARTARKNNFPEMDQGRDGFDLQVPDGEEAPTPAFVLPGSLILCLDPRALR